MIIKVYLSFKFQELRYQMDSVLKQKIANPTMELYNPHNRRSSPTSQLIEAIIELITTEDYSQQVQYTYMVTLGIDSHRKTHMSQRLATLAICTGLEPGHCLHVRLCMCIHSWLNMRWPGSDQVVSAFLSEFLRVHVCTL